jgi:hypothetical protein
MITLSPSTGNKSLLLGALGSQNKSPKASAQNLASLYKDRRNVTEAEFRTDYAKFKHDYQKMFGRKPGAAEKYDFVAYFCKNLNLSLSELISDSGVAFTKDDKTKFNLASYTHSFLAMLNARN